MHSATCKRRPRTRPPAVRRARQGATLAREPSRGAECLRRPPRVRSTTISPSGCSGSGHRKTPVRLRQRDRRARRSKGSMSRQCDGGRPPSESLWSQARAPDPARPEWRSPPRDGAAARTDRRPAASALPSHRLGPTGTGWPSMHRSTRIIFGQDPLFSAPTTLPPARWMPPAKAGFRCARSHWDRRARSATPS